MEKCTVLLFCQYPNARVGCFGTTFIKPVGGIDIFLKEVRNPEGLVRLRNSPIKMYEEFGDIPSQDIRNYHFVALLTEKNRGVILYRTDDMNTPVGYSNF